MEMPPRTPQTQVANLMGYQLLPTSLEMVLGMLGDTLNSVAGDNRFIQAVVEWVDVSDRLHMSVVFGMRGYARQVIEGNRLHVTVSLFWFCSEVNLFHPLDIIDSICTNK